MKSIVSVAAKKLFLFQVILLDICSTEAVQKSIFFLGDRTCVDRFTIPVFFLPRQLVVFRCTSA